MRGGAAPSDDSRKSGLRAAFLVAGRAGACACPALRAGHRPRCAAKWPLVLPPAATVSCLSCKGDFWAVRSAPALTASSAGAAAAGLSRNHGTFASASSRPFRACLPPLPDHLVPAFGPDGRLAPAAWPSGRAIGPRLLPFPSPGALLSQGPWAAGWRSSRRAAALACGSGSRGCPPSPAACLPALQPCQGVCPFRVCLPGFHQSGRARRPRCLGVTSRPFQFPAKLWNITRDWR